ncbi:MAG TPA: ATP-binding protein [Bryobacteraceae bacterium]|jgi:signal transduction histidine kinase|nr:ATP-binding protein [Bryobacteraceae bacterium]
MQSNYSHRVGTLASKLAEGANFNAAVGLMSEAHGDANSLQQARDTVTAALRDLQAASGFDFLAVTDVDGNVISNVPCTLCVNGRSVSRLPVRPGLTEIEGRLYQLESVPVSSGGENIAALVLAVPFQMHDFVLNGEGVLLRDGKAIESTLPRTLTNAVETTLTKNCPADTSQCEGGLAGEAFFFSEMQKGQLGPHYRLFCVQSLDRLAKEFTLSFFKILISIAAAGICVALLFTFMTSRFLSRQLRAFVAQLHESEISGGMSKHLQSGNAVRELTLLAKAYHHLVDCERRIRTQLEAARDAAQVANRLKDEFLTNISHEFRTPLNGSLGMTDILLATSLDEDQAEFAATTKSSALHLLTLVESVLDFSQLRTGDLVLRTSPFDLLKLVEAAASAIRSEAAGKGIRVEVESVGVSENRLVGDKARIRQVLGILCENAVKFTDTGFVRLRVECEGQQSIATIKIQVEDTGIGISPDRQNLIFERFTQADGSLTRARGGTGLGLALASHLVTLMGGQLGVKSCPDKGSAFWSVLDLPLAISDQSHDSVDKSWTGVVAC